MKNHRPIEEIRKLYNYLVARLSRSSRLPEVRAEISERPAQSAIERSESVVYQMIGERTESVLPIFRGLDVNLQKSGVKINFKAYVSLAVFVAFLASLTFFGLVPCILVFVFGTPLLPSFLFGLGAGLFASAFSIIAFYVYPIYRADKLRRALEDEMPFTTGYMSILTGAGVSPEKIFHSIAGLSVPLAISGEAKDVVRDVNLFGLDIISALEKVSKRTPSKNLRETLEGFISAIHSGSNSTSYLREKTAQFMKLKRTSLRKFSDTLSLLSEFYVALLLTGPLLIVIMLSVMAMLNQGNLGLLSPDLLLSLVTYVGLPLGSIVFLIILDAVTPRW
jgi:flagellar protein FlaJ